nr:hypothetical protein Q903MT_gene6366 [Picea sitchensis]
MYLDPLSRHLYLGSILKMELVGMLEKKLGLDLDHDYDHQVLPLAHEHQTLNPDHELLNHAYNNLNLYNFLHPYPDL